jgi:hypothetical protein
VIIELELVKVATLLLLNLSNQIKNKLQINKNMPSSAKSAKENLGVALEPAAVENHLKALRGHIEATTGSPLYEVPLEFARTTPDVYFSNSDEPQSVHAKLDYLQHVKAECWYCVDDGIKSEKPAVGVNLQLPDGNIFNVTYRQARGSVHLSVNLLNPSNALEKGTVISDVFASTTTDVDVGRLLKGDEMPDQVITIDRLGRTVAEIKVDNLMTNTFRSIASDVLSRGVSH